MTKSKATVYHCDECKFDCTQDKDLQLHKKAVHLKEKNLICQYVNCDRAYAWPADLNRHVLVDHTDTKFQCDQCPKSYGRKDKLKEHIDREHKNIRYYCPHHPCTKNFSRRDLLNGHVKLKHSEPIENRA